MKSISVVINARLSSTRVPKKLLRPFAETTLIQIALKKLNKMDFVDKRYLAAADQELIDMGKDFENIEILKRKTEAVKKGVNPQKITFEHYCRIPTSYILVFNPCLPLVTVDTIFKAVQYFQSTNYDSYTSIIETGDWVFDSVGNPITNKDPSNLTTNKNIEFFKAAHAFHIINKNYFIENGIHWSFKKNDPHMVKIPEEEYIDIDTETEMLIAEKKYLDNF